MSDHDKSNPRNPLYAIVRNISMIIDGVAFGLLDLVYRLFFRVTTLDIISNEVVLKFYGRVQLIIGVFMLFQLTLIILKGIMNPDSFMDSKTGGFNLITRISLALVMFALIIPINIENPQNEYQKQINNNGLLFGTLYSLQYRLLKNNTVGRLVLGTDATTSTDPDDSSRLTSASRIFTSTIVKAFYRINLKDEVTEAEDGTTPDANKDNWMCKSSEWHSDEYQKADVNPESVIEMGMADTCTVGGKERYALAYSGFISFITGFFFVFLFLSFTIEVAIRAIKLAMLRLIAPIPIISYMDPKGSKDGAFNAWVKTLTSTYLDLFIRLAVIHFVLYIIEGLIKGGIVMGDGRVRVLATIIIIAGLLIFAKDAPKFFRQALGMKDEPFRLFGGISSILALGSVGAGVVTGGVSRAVATRQNGGNIGKTILGAITGGAGGGWNAGKTFYTSKDAKSKDIMKANRAYAMKNYSNAEDESTFRGRVAAGFRSNLGLKTDFQKMEQSIAHGEAADSARARITKAFDSNSKYKTLYGTKVKANDIINELTSKGITASNYVNANGDITAGAGGEVVIKKGVNYSLKDLKDIYGRVQASGDNGLITAVDKVMKDAQSVRFDEIRQVAEAEERRTGVKGSGRALIVKAIEEGRGNWSENDLIVFDEGMKIHALAQKHPDEAAYADLVGTEYLDNNVSWGKYKGAAAGAGRHADQLKNSPEYFQAKADAARVSENQK